MSVPATPAVVQYKGKQNKMQKLARTQVKRNKMQKLARAQGKQECKIVTIVHEFAMRKGSSIHGKQYPMHSRTNTASYDPQANVTADLTHRRHSQHHVPHFVRVIKMLR